MASKKKEKTVKTEDVVKVSLGLSELYGFRKVSDNVPTKTLASIVLFPESSSEKDFSLRIWNEVYSSEYIEDEFLAIRAEFEKPAINPGGWTDSVLEKLKKEVVNTNDFGFVCSSVVKSPGLKNSKTKDLMSSKYSGAEGIFRNTRDGYGVQFPKHFDYKQKILMINPDSSASNSSVNNEAMSSFNNGDIICFDGHINGSNMPLTISDFYKVPYSYDYHNVFVKNILSFN